MSALQGTAVRAARKTNSKFVIEQRAEIRARLVQLALENKLRFGQARLTGFATTAPIDVAEEFDLEFEML